MNICKSIKFCFYLGFAGIVAHAMIISVMLLGSCVIDAITKPFLRQFIEHDFLPSVCALFAVSLVVSPLALCGFRKAMNIANDVGDNCAVKTK